MGLWISKNPFTLHENFSRKPCMFAYEHVHYLGLRGRTFGCGDWIFTHYTRLTLCKCGSRAWPRWWNPANWTLVQRHSWKSWYTSTWTLSASGAISDQIFSPPARWGLLDFMSVDFRLPPPSASSGPQPRPSTPSVPCRTSTARIHAKCSLPDLNHENPRQVFPDGPQPRPSTPSVPCRTSTARIHAKCSLPDLNRRREWQKICQVECQIELR